MKKKLLFFIILFLFLLFPTSIFALDYKIDYQVEYLPKKTDNSFLTEVNLLIKITHLRSDIYVKSLTLKFPDSFKITNLRGKDDYDKLDLDLVKEGSFNSLVINLKNPNVGKNSINNIYLNFYQDKIFNEVGNIWETIIPIISDENQSNYQVIINLPKEVDKQISIAKPKPSLIKKTDQGTKIYWLNPNHKTIYAVFGDEQYYQFKINYTLTNEKLIPVIKTITLLPDTSYQTVYHNLLNPIPRAVYLDEDGNYLADYLLAPKEIKKITYQGEIVLTTKMNQEKIRYDKSAFLRQKNYLLNATNYWRLSDVPQINGNSPKDVYQYVVSNLKYNYDNLDKRAIRLGAEKVIKNPNDAICLEFTDFYIALAREKGIFTRQIIGYGFSQEERLRPLSLLGDILHSWVEYYDVDNQYWKQIDPTWENTSGIDYFDSLDLNHIAFVIRGKDPQLPLPAGSFKLTPEQQDIFITPTKHKPQKNLKIKIIKEDIPKQLFLNQNYKAKIVIKNLSNRMLYNLFVNFASEAILFSNQSILIDVLPPFGETTVTVNLLPKKSLMTKKSSILITIDNMSLLKKEIKIYPVTKEVFYFIILFTTVTTGLFFIRLIKKIKKRNDR
jgi:hypothetical protein